MSSNDFDSTHSNIVYDTGVDSVVSSSVVSEESPSDVAEVTTAVAAASLTDTAIDLAALEQEAEQLTQQEVETLLSFLAEYYTIDLVRLSSSSKDSSAAAKDPAIVAQQQQLVQDILKVEGCAQCLVANTYEHDEHAHADDASKSAESLATSKVANDAFILLGCKLLHCRHVVHVLCVLKLQAKLRAAAAAGSVSKMILPTLDLCHSTSFFRVIAFPIGTQGSLLPSLPSSHNSPHHPTHTYYLELASTHHISNAQNLHLTWTHQPVHSFMDMKTGNEYLMLLGNHPEANHSSYGDQVRPIDCTIGPNGVANASTPANFASFFLTRGKLHFTVIQQTDKSGASNASNVSAAAAMVPQISNSWTTTCNYDLSTTSASTPHMKLVMVDAQSKNVLTIGVQKIHTASNNATAGTNAAGAATGATQPTGTASLAIAYIKYEFAPAIATPPLSPPLSLNATSAPTTSVVSVLAGGVGLLDSLSGSTGALASSALFPVAAAAGTIPRPTASNFEEIVRDPRDPPGMRIGGPGPPPDPLAGIAGIDPRDPPRGVGGVGQGYQHFERFERDRERGGDRGDRADRHGRSDRGDRGDRRGDRFGGQGGMGAGGPAGATDFYNSSETGDWDLAMLDAALDRQLAERRNKPDPFGDRGGSTANNWDGTTGGGAGGNSGARAGRRGSDDRGVTGAEGTDHDALFLPALPSFPTHLMNQPGMSQPVLNLTLDQVKGNVVRLAKSHSGSRFVQSKLESRDALFFALFYDEMREHVPELMVDNFGHFAIEKLIALCNDEQALTLLQRLAPSINIVACQKHGSFSVQALVDTLHTPAQIYTLVEAMKPDIMRIITHASGHFVVLRMLQRFPYASTKFIDEALIASCSTIGTDHHGLRVVKAVLAVRRSTELTRLFKQVARLTMKLVENQYGNYCVQSVLDVAPPGVRTNIKVKMEGKYMRLSKQKFSSNVVEKCLKQSSSHWRTIIIRELTAQPAVSELLRDRYGNYVLQTALAVANAQQVQEILRSITPYLPSLRDNVRSKWKKMLKKAGSLAAAGQAGSGFTGLGGDSPQPSSPASPASPASRSESPFNDPPSLNLANNPNASVFINPNQHHHAHHQHHNNPHGHHPTHGMHPQLGPMHHHSGHNQHQPHQQQFQQQAAAAAAHHHQQQQQQQQQQHGGVAPNAASFSPNSAGSGEYAGDRSGNFASNNWTAAASNFTSPSYGGAGGVGAGGAFNPNTINNFASTSSYSNPSGLGFNANAANAFSLNTNTLGSSLAALNNPYGVGVAGLNALGGVGGSSAGINAANANALAGLNYAGFGTNYGGVNNAFGALGGGLGTAQSNQTSASAGNAGLYDPNANLRMF